MIDPQSATPAPRAEVADWLYATAMGLVEGLTEFLPISSTGHLILVGQGVFGRADADFDVGIQIGAITAILILYRERLWTAASEVLSPARTEAGPRRTNLLWLILVAAIPASVLGLWLQDDLEALFHNPTTVALMMVIGGVLLLILEAWQKRSGDDESSAPELLDTTIRQAFVIGLFQCLALIPGTSRSGSMIAGAMVVGLRRTSAAEFSFLVGLPILYGASLIKLLDGPEILKTSQGVLEFSLATGMSFLSALLVVKPFVRFLQNHTFRPFAWYRIGAGGILLGLIWADII